MNRHTRRKVAKLNKVLYKTKVTSAVRKPVNGVSLPNDLCADIAKTVRNVQFINSSGGLCFFRSVIGIEFLRLLGIPATLTLGGRVYRVGPDPRRDVVAFCGPGNAGEFIPGQGIIGHYWIESGSDVIDFSVGDWRGDMTPDLSLEPDDHLGPIQWAVDPPDFFWLPRADLDPIPGQYTPELGNAYYTGWRGAQPSIEDNLREFKTGCDWQVITRHFEECCEGYALRERVWATQNGHTAVRLSQLHNLVGFPPPRDEQCVVLRGEVEITPKAAAEILSKLDGHTFTKRSA
jgi:hypothetical protein